MMPIAIRAASVDDAAAVARLTHQLGYPLSDADARVRLARFLDRDNQRFVVADDGGAVVGWMHIGVADYIEADTFVTINGLVVDSECRGRGVGGALLDEAERWARERGLSIVRVWSSVAREGAHRFYERHGYARIKTQHAFAKSVGSSTGDFSGLVPTIQ
jgi:ribosomal protein S18 acetylase RimI-like enzyme